LYRPEYHGFLDGLCPMKKQRILFQSLIVLAPTYKT
jgi:hypothetical protein